MPNAADWYLLLTPLGVLAVLLLVRFVGCDLVFPLNAPPPTYDSAINNMPDLVARWTLNEAPSAPSGTTAKDERGSPPDGDHPGKYQEITGGLPGDDPQSAPIAAPAGFLTGEPSLLPGLPSAKSVRFAGGFVRVFDDADPSAQVALNPTEFSIVAWVRADLEAWKIADDALGQKTFRSVITSRQDSGAKRGYQIYGGPDLTDPSRTDYYWQVWVGNADPGAWVMCIDPNPLTSLDTCLIATCDGTTLKLYVDGGNQIGNDHIPTQSKDVVPPFVIAADRPLYIAGGKTDLDPPDSPRYPFIGNVQEVALFSRVLTEGQSGEILQLVASGNNG